MDKLVFPFSKWVKIGMLADINGYTPDAVKGKMKGGVWRQGLHWKKAPDGNIMVNPREIDNWIDTHGEATQRH